MIGAILVIDSNTVKNEIANTNIVGFIRIRPIIYNDPITIRPIKWQQYT